MVNDVRSYGGMVVVETNDEATEHVREANVRFRYSWEGRSEGLGVGMK